MSLRTSVRRWPIVRDFYAKLNNLTERTQWVSEQLARLPAGEVLLDAGCGSQQFKKYSNHLNYKAQDFGQYVSDDKEMLGAEAGGLGAGGGYAYGALDYTGNIWEIAAESESFDAILCTEVFEHIPYPIETVREFSRLLRPGGKLILTAPSNCLRHMDPYFFYSGFSDRWYEEVLKANAFEIEELVPVGDYYSWLAVEVARTAISHGVFSKFLLAPAFAYYFSKRKTAVSTNTLCMGYHVLATKISARSLG